MVIDKYIEQIIQSMTGCDAQEACDMWYESEIGQLVDDYINKKIETEYGENFIMGSASGGTQLKYEISSLVDIETDKAYDLNGKEVER